MRSVNAVGKLTTRLRQAHFDNRNVEKELYTGEELTPLFTYELHPVSWAQTAWYDLREEQGPYRNAVYYPINGPITGVDNMHYLMAFSTTLTFPEVKLKPTNTDVYNYGRATTTVTPPADIEDIYYVSIWNSDYKSYKLYIGIKNTLEGYINAIYATDTPSKNYYTNLISKFNPRKNLRKRISWSKNAVVAAHTSSAFVIDGDRFIILDKDAIYNALQYKYREDVFNKTFSHSTNLPVEYVISDDDELTLLPDLHNRSRSIIHPFSFTNSIFSDRGEEGKFKSAYPVLMGCKRSIGVNVDYIDDVKELLILEEEQLYSMPEIYYIIPKAYTGGIILYENSTKFYTILSTSFSIDTVAAEYKVSTNLSSIRDDWGYFDTDKWEIVKRPSKYNEDGDQSFKWSDWLENTDLKLVSRARAFGAVTNNFELGQMKADFRTRKWLFEKYSYPDTFVNIKPGDAVKFDLSGVSGQFKFAYVMVQNYSSELDGHHFNYTNDKTVLVKEDPYTGEKFYSTMGLNGIESLRNTLHDEEENNYEVDFVQSVQNAMFAQRLPKEECAVIYPCYSDFINSIMPGGSVNMQAIGNSNLNVKTTKALSINTTAYMVKCIPVSWNIGIFSPI